MATPLKRYKCTRWPSYRIRDLKFEAGFLDVFTAKEISLVEGADGFGAQIVEVPLEESTEPLPDERAHQGTQSTAVQEEEDFGEANEAVTPESVFEEPVWPQDEVKILGGGYYEYQGERIRGKKNLPPQVRDLV